MPSVGSNIISRGLVIPRAGRFQRGKKISSREALPLWGSMAEGFGRSITVLTQYGIENPMKDWRMCSVILLWRCLKKG